MSIKRSSNKVDSQTDGAILDQNSQCYCFICDDRILTSGVKLVMGRTPYSNTELPAKIGQLIGDDFMVVISVSDVVCRRCSMLISHLDKLETDAYHLKKTLTGYLASKYKLDHKEICANIESQFKSCQIDQDFSLDATSKEDKEFSTSSSLPNDSSQWTCLSCCHYFVSESECMNHMRRHLSSDGKCDCCGVTCADSSMVDVHMHTHAACVFECSVCQMKFDQKANLDAHSLNHMDRFKCTECDAQYHFIEDLKTHEQNEHSRPSDSIYDLNVLDKPESGIAQEQVSNTDGCESATHSIEFYSCPSCPVTYLNKVLFIEHMKMHEVQPNNTSIENGEMPDIHEEVLKNASAPVIGDCQIDDDLEDLFEKLHAETSASPATLASRSESSCLRYNKNEPYQDENLKDALCNSYFNGLETKEDTTDVQNNGCLESVQNFLEGSETVTATQTVTDKVTQPFSKLSGSSQTSSNIKKIELLASTTVNSEHCDSSFSSEIVGIDFDHQNSNIVPRSVMQSGQGVVAALLHSSQQSTLLYVGASNDLINCDEQVVVFQNAITNERCSEEFQMLQYVIDDEVTNTMDEYEIQTAEESNMQLNNFEQNKPDQELAQKNSGKVCGSEKYSFSSSRFDSQTPVEAVLKCRLKAHHNEQILYCSICSGTFPSIRRLLDHLESHVDETGPLNCPLCPQECKNCFLLRDHMVTKHLKEKAIFACRFCCKTFSTKRSFSKHEGKHAAMFLYSCDSCQKKFSTEEQLIEHTSSVHRKCSNCRFCGKEINKSKSLRNHEQRHLQQSNNYECDVCKRIFKTKTGFRHHAASHTGEFKFCCDFCGRGFMSRMMLEEHRSRHTKEERYVCDVCGRKFTFQSTYWIHRKWHDNPYPYTCNFCGRMFRHTSLLAVHKRKHTGERPYKCPHCPLTFPVGGTLKRHLILHTGAYPFHCGICKRGFTAKHKYTTHLTKVHGELDVISIKHPQNEFKMVVPDTISKFKEDDTKSFVSADDAHSKQCIEDKSLNISQHDGKLFSDRLNMPTREVKIELDESYHAVATVTLP